MESPMEERGWTALLPLGYTVHVWKAPWKGDVVLLYSHWDIHVWKANGSKAVQPLSSMGLSIHVMMYVPVGVQQYILSLPWDFTYMYFPVGVQQYNLSLPWDFPYMYIPVGV
jgi:hypothetical protein